MSAFIQSWQCSYTDRSPHSHPAPITKIYLPKARKPQQTAHECHSQAHHKPTAQMLSCSSSRHQLGQFLSILLKPFLMAPTPLYSFYSSSPLYSLSILSVIRYKISYNHHLCKHSVCWRDCLVQHIAKVAKISQKGRVSEWQWHIKEVL